VRRNAICVSVKSCHLRTIAQLCPSLSSQLRHASTVGKTLVEHSRLRLVGEFRALHQISTGFMSCQVQIHFASKSCVLLYWYRYCTALEQWASAKLRRSTRNGITELSVHNHKCQASYTSALYFAENGASSFSTPYIRHGGHDVVRATSSTLVS